MIASVCDRRRDGKSSFRTLKEYLVDKLRSDDLGESEDGILTDRGTVVLQGSSGVVVEHNGLDMETLVQEFESVVAMKPNVEDPIYHFIISWAESDQPSDQMILESAREAIERLGFDGHQFLSAIHRDTDNPHVHVAVNRIHPDTYKVKNPYNDYYNLGRLMSEIEDRHGFQVTPQGGGRQSPVQDFDSHGDVSFLNWCRENVKPAVQEVLNNGGAWEDLRSSLHGIDVELVERGGGFVFRSTDSSGASVAVKASSVDRGFSKTKLEAVLGELDEPNDQEGVSSTYLFESNAQFEEWAKEELGDAIKKWSSRKRASWQSLHKTLEEHNCQLIQYGQGLSIVYKEDSSVQLAASKVSRILSLGKLEQRLGGFEKSDSSFSAYATSRDSKHRRYRHSENKRLRERYKEYRSSQPNPEKLRKQISSRIKELRREAREERRDVYRDMPPSLIRKAYLEELQSTLIRRIQGERLRLIQQYNADQAVSKTLGWREWVEEQAAQGDPDALQQVHAWHHQRHSSDGRQASVSAVHQVGYIEVSPSTEAMLGWRRRTRRNGTTDFYTATGQLVLTRQRNGLRLRNRADSSVRGAMQMAIDSYGQELRLTGSSDFKRQAIEALVALEKENPGRSVRLSDPELQAKLVEERARVRTGAPRQR
ncbi:relaxase/mobilization nuclease domain-containing protein [Halomonas elongata]|uniref:relaxase/mobilization nuclease domain-containing protein n=1 Tax=Halomonas elongata TaxID=2746 RepID=UPI00255AE72A|nr:relaxase/mobilization nuclease domain-containing protein [Halomonas elongata]MDL4860770.1 relaxase/mobilization nuclease domain-containing protein [Halomonas elongata]